MFAIPRFAIIRRFRVSTDITTRISGYVLSLLRTGVPILWGAIITWALAHLTWLQDLLGQLGVTLDPNIVPAWLYALLMIGFYALARKIEPHLPAWLTRLVLGANTAPVYAPTNPDGSFVITSAPVLPPTSLPTPAAPADDDPPKHAA